MKDELDEVDLVEDDALEFHAVDEGEVVTATELGLLVTQQLGVFRESSGEGLQEILIHLKQTLEA